MSAYLYKKAQEHILSVLDEITAYTDTIARSEEFVCEADLYQDATDYWNAYNDIADLNFCFSHDENELVCIAYPIVDGIPNYDARWAVRVPTTFHVKVSTK